MNENQNSNAVALYREMGNPLEAAIKLGDYLVKSKLFGATQLEQGVIISLTCFAQGITPLDFARTYHIIEGQASMRADAMLARFISDGGDHEIIEQSSDRAAVKLTMKGKSHVFALTWEEAQLEPFTSGGKGFKKNWATPRARMQTMWARVISQGVRTMAPGIVAGTYTPEEVEDFEPQSRAPKPEILTTKTEVVTTPEKNSAPKQAKVEHPIVDVTPEPSKPVVNPEPVKHWNHPKPETQKPEPVKPAPSNPEESKPSAPVNSERLSAETITALQAAIGEAHWAAAETFLVEKEYMKSTCGDGGKKEGLWFTLKPIWAKKIIDDPKKFLTHALGVTL